VLDELYGVLILLSAGDLHLEQAALEVVWSQVLLPCLRHLRSSVYILDGY
jgi:hypothetical protein